MRNKLIAFVMIIAMFVSLGFVPGGEVSAAGLLSANIPVRYQQGYDIYRAIDISAHQGNISVAKFQQIRSLGITHVIIRSSYTRWKTAFRIDTDKYLANNINNAYAAGLKVGIYHYSQAKTVAEARKEAAHTIKVIAPYRSKISLPVVFDYEFGKRLKSSYAKKKGKTAMTNIAIAYCNAIKAAGYTPMVYASASFFNGYVNRNTLHSMYPIWVAHYTRGGKATDYSQEVAMWQYSSSGRLKTVAGKAIISGRVDMNYIFIRKGTHLGWVPNSTATVTTASKKYKVKLTGSLNVRKGPGKKYKKVSSLKKGKTVTILSTKKGWGKIKKNRWISLKYTKRI